MPSIQIRSVAPGIYNRLKKTAVSHHRSISSEALSILEKSLGVNTADDLDGLYKEMDNAVMEMRAKYGNAPSSVDLIREDRGR